MRIKRHFKVILVVILVLVMGGIIYLNLPSSPIKSEYFKLVNEFTERFDMKAKIITEEDLKTLPEPIEKYFIKNGYVGIGSASEVIFEFKDADFALGKDKPRIKIDYTVHDFVKEPARLALIDSKIYGLPFQGIDRTEGGNGYMKGVVAKHIPVFDMEFENTVDASYLAECFLHPSFALQENITYKQIDKYTVEATIKFKSAETVGIVKFNEKYEMTSLVVEKRLCSGTNTYEQWSAIIGDYKVINGINRPTKFQGVWNYEEGDLIYFDSNGMEITYR